MKGKQIVWICHNKGLFSIVNYVDQNDRHKETGEVLLRARSKEHIPEVFPKYASKMRHTPYNDYAYRVRIDKDSLSSDLAALVSDIDYPNFKASVSDRDLLRIYSNFWSDSFHQFDRTGA